MNLDSQLVELDKKGLFANNTDTQASHVVRSFSVLRSVTPDKIRYVARCINASHTANVSYNYTFQHANIQDRFDVDTSWIPVLHSKKTIKDTLDLCSNANYGEAYPAYLRSHTEVDLPPFVVVNPASVIKESIVQHELIHVPRINSWADTIRYPTHKAYEEIIADTFSPLRAYMTPFTYAFSDVPEYTTQNAITALWHLQRARSLLTFQVGKESAEYILMRMPYEEVKDFLIDNKKRRSIRHIIGETAEKGNVRYQVMKHRLSI
ncbi:MAG TPA: hypothetical protein VK158_06820 [Acidobacteriota bacterium]|nr:hypothetical protein [Acidobacteriota bacterium]